jgi:hypothetical protein
MGDTVPLLINSGRLQVSSSLRIVGMEWTVGDDGTELLALTVGTPRRKFNDPVKEIGSNVHALTLR